MQTEIFYTEKCNNYTIFHYKTTLLEKILEKKKISADADIPRDVLFFSD